MAKLVIFRGDSVETELPLKRQTVRIGRDTRNDIVLDDKTVTRFHAEIVPEGGTYYISDLNSRNGVWINNQRISGKTPLTLGVPVTVGAYELTLEDDVGTADFSELPPAAAGRTIVSTSAIPIPERSVGGSASRAVPANKPASKPGAVATAAARPAVFWSVIGIGTLILCLGTYLVVRRFIVRPAPVQVAAAPTPGPTAVDAPPVAPAPQAQVTENIVAGYLEASQYAIEDRDYQAARDDIEAALEIDPTNQDLLAKKKEIEDLMAAPPPVPVKPAPPKPAAPTVVEAPGIPRNANEAPADYTARVGRIQSNMREGMRSLDQDDFATALTRFQAVVRDQAGYQNVDALITDATARQKRLVDTALDNGQQNERAGNLLNAVRWYDRALRLDPNSPAAQQKLASVAERRTKQGMAALERADVFRKRNDIPKAVAAYQEAADLLPSSNEKKAEAQQWLDKLKQ